MSEFESELFDGLLLGGFVCAIGVFLTLLFITAPYGRHNRPGWGPSLNSVLGWVIMESAAVAVFAAAFLYGNGFRLDGTWVFFAFWQVHYIHRAFIYPFRMRNFGKRSPALIVGLAVFFNLFNGYVNGRYLGVNGGRYTLDWLGDPRFIAGSILFIGGMALNIYSDGILLGLRQTGEKGYKTPMGGPFRWVSSPNYLGECIEWCGWALATWSAPGLLFAVWTAANLVPRALSHHAWYRANLPDYPQERKAIIPFVY